ncbi:hypothetical protein F4808DRAFT_417637 [Astrocystis sublimbata]|nr:hypothetical protein F4808DRAFT_417637 [Astrocystis sublimbata]
MSQSPTMRFVSFPHYESGIDPLEPHYHPQFGRLIEAETNLDLRRMPPTVSNSLDQVKDQQAENEENEIVRRLPGYESNICTLSHENMSPESMESWVDEFTESKLSVDIDRLARWAVHCSEPDVVKYLVEERRADLSSKDQLGRSAIFYCRHREVFAYIVSRNVVSETEERYEIKHLNLKDDLGRTPLHYAVIFACEDVVEYLLAFNADINIQDTKGQVAVQYLNKSNSANTCRLLFALRKLMDESKNPHGIDAEFKESVQTGQQLTQLQSDLVTGQDQGEDPCLPFWIHLYWTNGILVYAALRKLWRYNQRQSSEIEEVLKEQFDWGSSYRHRLGHPEHSYESNFNGHREMHMGPIVTIVFPCLHLREKEWQQEMRKKTMELQKRVADGYSEHHIHHERTLDETYYPSLSNMVHEKRNNDQVVSKEYNSTGKTKEDKGSFILTTPQLWIWRAGDHIISAYPTKLTGAGWEALYEPDITRLDSRSSAGVLTGRLMSRHVSRFGLKQHQTGFPSALDIFEGSVVKILEDVQTYTEGTKASRPSMEKDHEYITRIANVREQLSMIRVILGQQLDILTRYINDFEQLNPEDLSFLPGGQKTQVDDRSSTTEDSWDEREDEWAWKTVKYSLVKIDGYLNRISKIDGDAERVEKRIQDQLNLLRTYASIRDARAGLIVSAAVIGFTVTTIIFAPLAFTTALFALPLDTLLSNQVGINGPVGDADAGQQTTTPAYTSRYVGTWFAVAEIVTLVVTFSSILLCMWFIDETVVHQILPNEKAKKVWRKTTEYWNSTKRALGTEVIRYFWNLVWNAIVGIYGHTMRAERGRNIELRGITVSPNSEREIGVGQVSDRGHGRVTN